jgi:CRISPR-associated protein Cas5d
MLSNVFWKPEFQWVPKKVEILSPIEYFNFYGNEYKTIPSLFNLTPMDEESKANRTQRLTTGLSNVDYLITAQIVTSAQTTDAQNKYEESAIRRLKKGQWFKKPYMGIKEYSVDLEFVEKREHVHKSPAPINKELGIMVFDVFNPYECFTNRFDRKKNLIKDKVLRSYFNAEIRDGVIHYPDFNDSAVLKDGGR